MGGKELIDKGLLFWTLTMWEQGADMKSFRNSIPHRNAMRKLPDWCSEATFAHWLQEEPVLPGWSNEATVVHGLPEELELPDWNIVHEKIVTEGIISKVRMPTERHLLKAFPPLQWTRLERVFKKGKKADLFLGIHSHIYPF